ncbi:MAG: two pore domain potassium channel family protein [Spirochaetes bacterium]|nr:two pore domain potassium channel family protein [Spirochaetota bacterium]
MMKINIWNIINNPRNIYYIIGIYILAAIIFSFIYWFLLPQFEGAPSLKHNACVQSALPVTDYFGSFYFSITSQTTVGYGDIIPATYGARIVSGAQAFFGYFYLAFSISIFTCKALVKSTTFKSFFLEHGKDIVMH